MTAMALVRERAARQCRLLGHSLDEYDNEVMADEDKHGELSADMLCAESSMHELGHVLAGWGSFKAYPRGHLRLDHLRGCVRGEHEVSALAIELLVFQRLLSRARFRSLQRILIKFVIANNNATPYRRLTLEPAVKKRMQNPKVIRLAEQLYAAVTRGQRGS